MKTPVMLLARYRESKSKLNDFKQKHMPLHTVLSIRHPRYVGYGVVSMTADCPPDEIDVTLQNGNVWRYPIDHCNVAIPELWPAWVTKFQET